MRGVVIMGLIKLKYLLIFLKKIIICNFFIFATLSAANAQSKNYIPDPDITKKIEQADAKVNTLKDLFYRCAWREIALLSNANESISETADAAITLCSKENRRAEEAFGERVNVQFGRSDGRYDYSYISIWKDTVEKNVRALVIRFRARKN